jgi:acetyl/propionyl-CoA carboxylase alpha subunit
MAGVAVPLRVVPAHGGGNGSTPGSVVEAGAGGTTIVDGSAETAELVWGAAPRARLTIGDRRHDLLILPLTDGRLAAAGVRRIEVVIDGWRFELDLEPESRARLRDRATRSAGDRARGGPAEVRAIIPGRVVAVDVAEGDVVEAGQRVLVADAMKMQNEVRAPRAGTIGRVAVGAGQTIELGDVLVVIE